MTKRKFVFSAIGPGEEETAIGLGVRMFSHVPTFDANIAYGISEKFNLVSHVSTLFLASVGDIGVRYRLGDEYFSLGFKALANFMYFELLLARGAALGAGGGLLLSTGGQNFQFTLGMDVPMYFVAGAQIIGGDDFVGDAGTVFAYALKPNTAFEFKVTDSLNLYLQSDVYLFIQGGKVGVLPTATIGLAWN